MQIRSLPCSSVTLARRSSQSRNRTHLSALKGQYPSPIDERAELYLCAHCERKVGREALESSIPDLQSGALPSKLPAQNFRPGSASSSGAVLNKCTWPKKLSQRNRPGVFATPGLCASRRAVAHQRVGLSVIFAYFYRWRARSLIVHLPVGQTRCRTATLLAISARSLVLNATFQ